MLVLSHNLAFPNLPQFHWTKQEVNDEPVSFQPLIILESLQVYSFTKLFDQKACIAILHFIHNTVCMDMCLENIIGITNISPVFRENQFLNWFRRIVLNQFYMQLPENTVLSTEGILISGLLIFWTFGGQNIRRR